MIDILDIKKSINKIINDNFEVKVLSNKVKDNFKTPAFFTDIKPVIYDYETELRHNEQYLITIHYFPNTLNDEIENMKVLQKLRKLFDRKLEVKHRKLEIMNIRENLHEGTLFFRFNLDFRQYKQFIDDSEKMAEIYMDRKDD